MPVLGVVLSLVSPVPISLIGIRQGVHKAFLAVVFVTVSMALPFGLTGSLLFFLSVGFLGVVFSVIAKNTSSAGEAVLGLAVTALVARLIFMAIMVYAKGHNPFVLDESSMDVLIRYLKTPELNDDVLETIKQNINLSIPSFLIVAAAIEAFVNYLLVSKIEGRRQRMRSDSIAQTETDELKVHPLPPFEQWAFPRSMLAAFLLAFLIPLFSDSNSSIILRSIEFNLKFVSFVMFFIQGYSFAWWWVLYRNYSYGVRLSILIVLLLFVLVFSMVIIVVGVLDIAIDLREKIRRRNK